MKSRETCSGIPAAKQLAAPRVRDDEVVVDRSCDEERAVIAGAR
jgi:hypothetical protein